MVSSRYSAERNHQRGHNQARIDRHRTGEWVVTFGLEVPDNALPLKTPIGELNGDDSVSIDLGIQNYIDTSDTDSVDCLDLVEDEEHDRLRREQQSFSRKEQRKAVTVGSTNVSRSLRQIDQSPGSSTISSRNSRHG